RAGQRDGATIGAGAGGDVIDRGAEEHIVIVVCRGTHVGDGGAGQLVVVNDVPRAVADGRVVSGAVGPVADHEHVAAQRSNGLNEVGQIGGAVEARKRAIAAERGHGGGRNAVEDQVEV